MLIRGVIIFLRQFGLLVEVISLCDIDRKVGVTFS